MDVSWSKLVYERVCTILANKMAPDNASIKFEVHLGYNFRVSIAYLRESVELCNMFTE